MDEILANHKSFMASLNIPQSEKSLLEKYIKIYTSNGTQQDHLLVQQKYCLRLSKTLSTEKDWQQKYFEIVYSHSGITRMWILKEHLKHILDNLNLTPTLKLIKQPCRTIHWKPVLKISPIKCVTARIVILTYLLF